MFPFKKYDSEDPVTKWFNKEKSQDLAGESWDALNDCEFLDKAMAGLGESDTNKTSPNHINAMFTKSKV